MEALNRAAIDLMLKEDHPFREIWIRSHMENVQRETLAFFSPILNPSKLERIQIDVDRTLTRALTNAFHLRARLIPPKGQRYELVQFRPGTVFNPEYMSPLPAKHNHNNPTIGTDPRVKTCVHGCLVSHRAKEEPVESESLKALTQPFVSSSEGGLDPKHSVFQSRS